jgi:hypothetical protein
VKGFFIECWNVIKGAFSDAWDFIKAIVDKVVGAVDTVKDAVRDVTDFLGLTEESKLIEVGGGAGGGKTLGAVDAARAAATGRAGRTDAHVTVDFANAPKGTRVTADPRSTADVDMTVGYQMGAIP